MSGSACFPRGRPVAVNPRDDAKPMTYGHMVDRDVHPHCPICDYELSGAPPNWCPYCELAFIG